jgi:hypothetical protein
MKFRTHELFLGVFLTIAVFAIGFVTATSVPSPNQQIEKTDHQQTANEGAERTAEKQIAYYTKWLAWFTGALVAVSGIQGYFLLRADKTARIAAIAATQSAKAAVAIELPILRMNAGGLGYGTNQDKSGKQFHVCWIDKIILSNLGRTNAFPVEIQLGWTVGDSLPETPSYPFLKTFPANEILDPIKDSTEIMLSEFEYQTVPGLYELLRTRETNLWFYCNLVYLDFMDTRREAGFCWKQYETIGMGVLRPDATPAYNRKA